LVEVKTIGGGPGTAVEGVGAGGVLTVCSVVSVRGVLRGLPLAASATATSFSGTAAEDTFFATAGAFFGAGVFFGAGGGFTGGQDAGIAGVTGGRGMMGDVVGMTGREMADWSPVVTVMVEVDITPAPLNIGRGVG
jgi:hypothetical protein